MISTVSTFFSLALLASIGSTSFKIDDWIAIKKGSLLIKNQLIPRDRHRRGVIELQNFSRATSDGVLSMELLTEYDCKKGTFRLINYRGFSEINLEGDLIYDWQGLDPRAFVGIPLASPAREVFELVCGFRRKV